MLTFTDQAAIDAPPQTVFEVIADLGRYEQWNPWLVRASGVAEEGRIVHVTAILGARRARVAHRILTVRRGAELRWCDVGWFTVLARGERARFVAPSGAGTAYRVELTVTGIATALVRAMFGAALVSGIRAETAALKQRSEALHRG